MAGLDGAGITSAGVNGAGTNGLPSPSNPTSPPSPVAPPSAGPFSTLARRQYSALARMRWQMFQNGLRSTRGIFEVGARTLAYTIYAVGGLGISVGIGFGAPRPSGAAGISRKNGLEVASVKSRKPKLTRPRTPSTRAPKRAGRRAAPIVTASVQDASRNIHNSSEPSCAPHNAVTR